MLKILVSNSLPISYFIASGYKKKWRLVNLLFVVRWENEVFGRHKHSSLFYSQAMKFFSVARQL